MTYTNTQLSAKVCHGTYPWVKAQPSPIWSVGLGWRQHQVLDPESLSDPWRQMRGEEELHEPDIREHFPSLKTTVLLTFKMWLCSLKLQLQTYSFKFLGCSWKQQLESWKFCSTDVETSPWCGAQTAREPGASSTPIFLCSLAAAMLFYNFHGAQTQWEEASWLWLPESFKKCIETAFPGFTTRDFKHQAQKLWPGVGDQKPLADFYPEAPNPYTEQPGQSCWVQGSDNQLTVGWDWIAPVRDNNQLIASSLHWGFAWQSADCQHQPR